MSAARAVFPVLLSLITPTVAGALTLPIYAAAEFSGSVGVNTHLRHRGSVYESRFDLIRERLLAAKIRHIRDGAMDKDGGFHERDAAERFAALGRDGIRTVFIFRPLVPREFVQGWPARVSPGFEAFELPNELNQRKDLPWAEALRVWMPLFHEYVRGAAQSRAYPIVGPSIADVGGNPHGLLGDQRAFLDIGNLHKYYRAFHPATGGYGRPGEPPCQAYRYGSLDYALCQVRRVSGDKPVWCTEAGYSTEGEQGRAVPPDIQAVYLTRMLLLHFKAGIQRTYVYQLADHGKDAGGSMGLLDAQGNEKPAYRAIAGLLQELADEGAARDEAPRFELRGDTGDVQGAAFAKSDGSFRLVLWRERSSFDAQAHRVDVQTRVVTLDLPAGWRSRRLLSMSAEGRWEPASLTKSGAVTLPVSDRPVMLDVAKAAP